MCHKNEEKGILLVKTFSIFLKMSKIIFKILTKLKLNKNYVFLFFAVFCFLGRLNKIPKNKNIYLINLLFFIKIPLLENTN